MLCAGEAGIYYLSLPYLEQRKVHSVQLPNAANFGFDYALLCKVRLQHLQRQAVLGSRERELQPLCCAGDSVCAVARWRAVPVQLHAGL